MKIYIKSKTDNTYLNPIVHGEHWVDSINEAFAFEKEIDELNILDIEELVVDCFLDKNNLCFVYIKNKKEIEYIKNISYFFDYNSFKIIKNDFNKTPNRQAEHYIIYNFLKGKDPCDSLNFGKKNFKKTLFLVKNFIKMIDNYHITRKYLKIPFPSISHKEFLTILKRIRTELKKG